MTEAAKPPVARLYEGSWFDFRAVWATRESLAYHFGYYDERARTHGRALLRMNEVMADLVGLGPEDRVVDLGCGIGGSTIWMARERGVAAVGVDISEAQVRRAGRTAARRGVDGRVEFLAADSVRTGLPDETFDVAWEQESFLHVPDKPAWLAEAHRLLRPGGRLVMEELIRPAEPHTPDDERMIRKWLDGAFIPDLAKRMEIEAWAREAGFADVRVTDVSANAAPSLDRMRRSLTLLAPVVALARRLRLRTEMQQRVTEGFLSMTHAFRAGLWSVELVTARKPR